MWKKNFFLDWSKYCVTKFFKELNPKIDFSSFEHLGIVEQLYEVVLSCSPSSSKKFDVL